MTKIDLQGQGKVLITGKNGHGKSAIGEAIFFALYGKPFRKIKKDELVNSINKKNMLVELELDVHGKHVKIVRGVKPNVLQVWIDGKQIDKAASVNDQQKYIERDLLGMNDKSFKQIVLLGSDMYVPFMTLSAADRRKFIDNLLDTNIYSVMSDVAKSNLGDEKLKQAELQNDIKRIELTINERNTAIKDLQSVANEKIDTLEAELATKKEKLEFIKDEGKQAKEAAQKQKELAEQIRPLKENLSSHKAKLHHLQAETFDVCPTCNRPMDDEHKQKIDDEKAELQAKIDDLQKEIAEKENELDPSIQEKYYALKGTYKELQQSIHDIEVAIKKANEQDSTFQRIEELSAQAKELQSELADKEKELKKVSVRIIYLEKFITMLKDDGIRAVIVDKYLPTINKLIRHYLDVLDFDIFFEFDQNFNERIVKQGKDFVYRQLSAGQRLRIDLCLLFTWRDIARMRNQTHTNLVIFDEIGSSTLDAEGVKSFIDLLASHDDNDTSMVISHNEDISAYFDKHWHVELKGSFSQITME